MIDRVTADGRCELKVLWTREELELERRTDAIAAILERAGLGYVDARRTAKEILRLPARMVPELVLPGSGLAILNGSRVRVRAA